MAERVMEIYRGLSEAERAQTGTEEYRARFEEIKQTQVYHAMNGYMLPTFAQEKAEQFDDLTMLCLEYRGAE